MSEWRSSRVESEFNWSADAAERFSTHTCRSLASILDLDLDRNRNLTRNLKLNLARIHTRTRTRTQTWTLIRVRILILVTLIQILEKLEHKKSADAIADMIQTPCGISVM